MTCEEFRKNVDDVAPWEATREMRFEMVAHMEECAECVLWMKDYPCEEPETVQDALEVMAVDLVAYLDAEYRAAQDN